MSYTFRMRRTPYRRSGMTPQIKREPVVAFSRPAGCARETRSTNNASPLFCPARTLVRTQMPLTPQTIVRKLRVLGVDPALAGATGYGIVEVEGSVARLVRYGALRLPRQSSLGARLREIHALIESLVEEFSPDAV